MITGIQIGVTALIAVLTVAWTTGGIAALRRRTILADLDIADRIKEDDLEQRLTQKAQTLTRSYLGPADERQRLIVLAWRLALVGLALGVATIVIETFFSDADWATIAINLFVPPLGVVVGLLFSVRQRITKVEKTGASPDSLIARPRTDSPPV